MTGRTSAQSPSGTYATPRPPSLTPSRAPVLGADAGQRQSAGVTVSVGTKGVKPTDMPTEAPKSHKKVSWRGALFPHRPLVDIDS